ncbi:MAG: hypothetical protein ACM3JH_06860 [Acidithiobacillales bacterium]
MKGARRFRTVAAGLAVLFLATAPALPARGQAIIKVSETVSFRFGFALQVWADWTQIPATGGTAGNLFVRRTSLYLLGQIAPGVSFYLRTDDTNLGKAPKDSGPGFFIEDAYLEWEMTNAFILDGGLILIPLCRNCLEQSVRQLTLDYGSYSFLSNGVTQSSVARDTGFQARGYVLRDRLEYRVGAFQGRRESGSRNSFRSAGRLQYDVFETEKGAFYPGTYLGTKRVLAVGAGYDLQGDYRAYAADLFLDLPVGGGNGVTGQVDVLHWDGGSTFPTLLRQNDVFVEGGYYISSVKLLPWGRYESQSFSRSVDSSRDQKRFQVGVTWYRNAHTFNIRGAWGRLIPAAVGVPPANQFTIQLQLFYF